MASSDQGQAAPKRRSLLLDIANLVRQNTATRSSILHDIAHIVLPVLFFLHFVITGTVVLIYTLYLHEPTPTRYSIGAAISFGILTVLLSVTHLWLYFRRRRAHNADIELASADKEKLVSPVEETRKFKTWRTLCGDFLVAYERMHYHDILKGWNGAWSYEKDGLLHRLNEFLSRIRRAVATLVGRERHTRHQNGLPLGTELGNNSNSPILEEHHMQNGNSSVSTRNQANVAQQYQRPPNDIVRSASQYESPDDVKRSFELHADPMNSPARERYFATQRTSQRPSSPEFQGLRSFPPHHQVIFPRSSAASAHMTRNPSSRGRSLVTATGRRPPPARRTNTPIPPPMTRRDSVRQQEQISLYNPNYNGFYEPFPGQPRRKIAHAVQCQPSTLDAPQRKSFTDFSQLDPNYRNSQVSDLSIRISPLLQPVHPPVGDVSPASEFPPICDQFRRGEGWIPDLSLSTGKDVAPRLPELPRGPSTHFLDSLGGTSSRMMASTEERQDESGIAKASRTREKQRDEGLKRD